MSAIDDAMEELKRQVPVYDEMNGRHYPHHRQRALRDTWQEESKPGR
ncbi:hypothetical protein F441_08491 [Phytophthora nicotianae CJ01A1]|uniref:Uncharacterized protein n=4 Tax=Phytophthora nicotianae TaxID=4792 RepID=V9F8W7_PHYNI|nr:hypothetical protein F443_08512 [Phytophthora nicotianae P1569]ETL93735.1 hypothetical protein L917_08177 [Phytophthora nicotianae]ETO75931.1 hypothetical protein F444_08577 [Phytophthora nicotianae P1976]ETP17037.1 hypothetical protein F441_08491 [Phytophthora nicotianae CJ01A1]